MGLLCVALRIEFENPVVLVHSRVHDRLRHSFSFHFIFNSLYRVKTSITKVTALQLALSTKQKPIYNFMSQLTYKKNIE